jgi:hypothetical protein
MYKTQATLLPFGFDWFRGHKRRSTITRYRMVPDIDTRDYSRVYYEKSMPTGERQRWSKNRTIVKREGRFLKAVMRVSVGL